LTKLVVEKEVANGNGGGAGKAKIVLCGHRCVLCTFARDPVTIEIQQISMGGLLAADALIQFVQNRPDAGAPPWPRIIACLAFDTPVCSDHTTCVNPNQTLPFQYLGLHPHVFKHQVTKAAEVVQTTKTFVSDMMKVMNQNNKQPTAAATTKRPVAALPAPEPATGTSGFWQRWGTTALTVGGAALAAGAAATATYYKKDEIGIGYTWAADHMKYVKNLWDEKELDNRLNTVAEYDKKMGILFRT